MREESDAGRFRRRRRRGSAPFVVADTSPLIALAAAGVLDVLRSLFGEVTISRAVREEVRAGGERPGVAELEHALRSGWIRVAPTPMATWRLAALDPGEASTIALADRRGGSGLVLMDDALGLAQAEASSLETLDTAALLLRAKRERLVDAVRPLLDELARKGFTVPEDRARWALEQADER